MKQTQGPILTQERAGEMLGVKGRYFAATVGGKNYREGTFTSQVFKASRTYNAGRNKLSVAVRFDDKCRNGNNTFSITAEGEEKARHGWRESFGGCCHAEVERVFPELAPLIKWHLSSTDGPMHYIANTVYLAGNRDHNGLTKGESKQIINGKTGLPSWKLEAVGASEGLPEYVDAEARPTETQSSIYVPWCRIGEGKERELDAARSVAIWPEATDEDLTAEPEVLRSALMARLPGLIMSFKADVARAGFFWSPKDI